MTGDLDTLAAGMTLAGTALTAWAEGTYSTDSLADDVTREQLGHAAHYLLVTLAYELREIHGDDGMAARLREIVAGIPAEIAVTSAMSILRDAEGVGG